MMYSKKESRSSSSDAPVASSQRPKFTRSRIDSANARTPSTRADIGTISDNCVLFLEQNHAKFNASCKRESIFFDECNREIISLTAHVDDSGSPRKTRIVVQLIDIVQRIEFLLPISKKILSIKFNPIRSVVAYHVERNIVEFINIKDKIEDATFSSFDRVRNFRYVLDDKRYIQSSRAKNGQPLGFLWTGPHELVIITDLSVEYYLVDDARRRLNIIKVFQSATNWFVFQPPITRGEIEGSNDEEGPPSERPGPSTFSLLIVSTGSYGNSIQPYLFRDTRVTKLQKFEVEGNWHDGDKLELIQSSITVGFIYGFVRLLVLQNESLNVNSKGAQVVLYTIDIESGAASKTHTLDLGVSGRFAINIVDNLVVAHDQPSRTSFIFDIAIRSTEKSDCPDHFVSLIDSRSIGELEIEYEDGKRLADMYSLNWAFFQPNFIIDTRLGLLYSLQLDIETMQNILQDNVLLLSFLALRSNSESLILRRCYDIICDSYRIASGLKSTDGTETVSQQVNPLADVSSAFEILSSLVKPALKLHSEPDFYTAQSKQIEHIGCLLPDKCEFRATIQQEDVDREIFRQLLNLASDDLERPASFHFVSSVLLEFIFAVRCRNEKDVDFCIYERLVKCLAHGKRFFQIIQMIRSHILVDSKQLACLLISMSHQFKPAGQLGIDMLQRLACEIPSTSLSELVPDC